MARAAVVLVICAASAWSGSLFTTADVWAWREASDPQITADGERVAFVEEWNDPKADRTYSNLRTASIEGKSLSALTEGPWRDTHPRWSSDGARLAYLSDRSGSNQIYLRTVGTTNDVLLALPELSPLTLAWSPDGSAIAFTAAVPVKREIPAWVPPAILPYLDHATPNRVQLFVVPVKGGPAGQLTTIDTDCNGEPVWTSDGRAILVSHLPAAGNEQLGDEIYSIRVSDGAARRLTERVGPDESPVPSPDGSKIAYLGHDYRTQSYVTTKLYVMNADGSRVKVLSGLLDRDVSHPQWSSDSRTVYFLADDHGSTHVYAARADGTVRRINGIDGRLRALSLADNGHAVSVRSGTAAPSEVISFAVDVPSAVTTIAAVNQSWLAGRDIGEAEEIGYPSGLNKIQAWVVKPAGLDSSKKYPLILDTLDPPGAMFGAEFSLRAQILAARGFVVLRVNPRGSAGYGEQFGNLLPSRFPGDDFEDLMRGLDYVTSKGYVNETQIMIAGGLGAAWAIGHTDRFAAAVITQPISDWTTDIATRPDGMRRAALWMRAMPWENAEQYVRRSPLFSAGNFKTPTLILAREHDDPESDELYFALRAKQVDSALVRLPEKGDPSEEVARLEAALSWFGRFAASH
ncbi:MAG: S9 family peptidase [Acidobacteriia bacterium]|nr:S9 family peptidase [Terriglobia bacterium]